MHDEPGQQSALLVQAPHAATHWVALHAKGGRPTVHGIGHARRAVAAVRARCARPSGVHALRGGAPRDTHVVLLAGVLGFAISAAAAARRVARRGLQLAHVAVRLAARGVATHPNGGGKRDHARHGHSRSAGKPRGATAVAVARAHVADDPAPARRLANEHARRAEGSARAAAAGATACRETSVPEHDAAVGRRTPTEFSVDQAAIGGTAGRRRTACAKRLVCGLRTRTRAAVAVRGACVARLPAERRGLARAVARAEPRAALRA